MTNFVKDFITSMLPISHGSTAFPSEVCDSNLHTPREPIPLLPALEDAFQMIKSLPKSMIKNQFSTAFHPAPSILGKAYQELSGIQENIKQSKPISISTYPQLTHFFEDIQQPGSLQLAFEGLTEEQKTSLLWLQEKISKKEIVAASDLTLLIKSQQSLKQMQEATQGWATYAMNGVKEKITEQCQYILGVSAESQQENLQLEKERKQANEELNHLKERMLSQLLIQSKPIPSDLKNEIKKQFSELSDLITKMALSKLIFYKSTSPIEFSHIYQAAENILRENPEISKATAFKKAISDTYYEDKKNTSLKGRVYLQFHLKITLPILYFYIDHFFTQLNEDIAEFCDAKMDVKFDYLEKFLLDPINNHFAMVENFLNVKICHPNQILLETPRAELQKFLSTVKINEKNPKALLSELAKTLSSRYIRSLHWVQSIKNMFPSISWVDNFLINMLIGFVDAIQIIVSSLLCIIVKPIEWILNLICQITINQIIKKVVLPTLLPHSSSGALSSSFRHQINLILWQKFAHLNEPNKEIKKTSPPVSDPITASPQFNKIKEFIDVVFKAIALEHCLNDPQKIDQTLRKTTSLSSIPESFHQFVMERISPFAAIEVIKILKTVLQNEFLMQIVYSAIGSSVIVLTKKASPTSEEERAFAENARVNELRNTVDTAVEKTIYLALNPAEKINEDIKIEIDWLKQEISSFVNLNFSTDNKNIQTIIETWMQLSHHMTYLSFREHNFVKIVTFIKEISAGFLQQTATLHNAIQQVQLLHEKSFDYKYISNFLSKRHSFLDKNPSISSIVSSLSLIENQLVLSSDLVQSTDDSFILALRKFTENAQHFERLITPNDSSKKQFQNALQEFKKQILATIKIFDDHSQQCLEDQKSFLSTIHHESQKLLAWTASLTPPELNAEDIKSSIQRFSNIVGPQFKNTLTSFLMSDINTLINMFDAKAKPNHWNAILWQGVGSYLKGQSQIK